MDGLPNHSPNVANGSTAIFITWLVQSFVNGKLYAALALFWPQPNHSTVILPSGGAQRSRLGGAGSFGDEHKVGVSVWADGEGGKSQHQQLLDLYEANPPAVVVPCCSRQVEDVACASTSSYLTSMRLTLLLWCGRCCLCQHQQLLDLYEANTPAVVVPCCSIDTSGRCCLCQHQQLLDLYEANPPAVVVPCCSIDTSGRCCLCQHQQLLDLYEANTPAVVVPCCSRQVEDVACASTSSYLTSMRLTLLLWWYRAALDKWKMLLVPAPAAT
ncbi:hypothetical protein RRG08_063420 [Elysia crispata]|uniref:Uncharacterized protein n=1 Tax=Elysia crispata TaxID=231223 RepID=A0AAE1A9E0_9GAST|nr:hypothetical protein RRG08_063420 [Elysia crispata]